MASKPAPAAAAKPKPTVSKPAAPSSAGAAGRGFKAMAVAAVAAQPVIRDAPSPPAPAAGVRNKVTRHIDPKVAARNNALNAMGGVKVDVFVRVRPKQSVDGDDAVSVTASTDTSEIILEDVTGHPAKYTYDKVYGQDSTQEQLYEDCVAPIVEQVCRGLSCAIFAYGQTGAGKTYTMRGDLSSDPNKYGIIQRSVLHLFKRLHEHDYSDIKVALSFLEIYNEELEDLLVDKPKNQDPKKKVANNLQLVDNKDRGCVVDGLTERPVETLEEVMQLLAEAEARCRFSETKMNKLSNRAHRIFTILASFKRYDQQMQATLTFVDLAGSEDISKSGAKGMTAREASHINKSLLTLGRVINALACNEKHIPYRDSKLTRLLSEALGGVCKTSFIACVSPCASSVSESNSTLRYAERAMEALNISQLPRWKQDEIMIDGLTRRVQQLVDELESIQRMHYEEVHELKNHLDLSQKENKALKRDLGQANRKIARLLKRKAQLKSGLAVMTQQRDTLQSQKDALIAELLETRRQRDGYLNDRNTLCTVMNSVRLMREKLLTTHNATEESLNKDALQLKKVIEVALSDIDDLHAEVARKKGLSSHNEKLADHFRDRMSAKLRALVQAVSEFKVDQDDSYSKVQQMVADMRGDRQKETAGLRSDVARTSTAMTSLLADIAQFASEVESAYKARLTKSREMSGNQRDELEVALTQMKTGVNSRLDELRAFGVKLEENMVQWADKVKLKLDENNSSADQFAKDLSGRIAALQAHLEGASAAQIMHLDEHNKALQKHLESERDTINAEAQRVINDMATYVQRLMTDHANKALQRNNQAVTGFQATVESLSEETLEYVAHQVAEQNTTTEKTQEWNAAHAKSIEEGQRANSAMHFTAKGVLKKIVTTSEQTDQELATEMAAASDLTAKHLANHLAAAKEMEEATESNTAKYRKQTAKGTADMQADAKKITELLTTQCDKFDAAAAKEKKRLETMHEKVRGHSETHTDDLFETEADTVQYVTNDIKRDTKDPPNRRDVKYPQKFDRTPAYEDILRDTAKDWEREHSLRTGKATPGEGVDFPGVKGPEDHSGIISSIKNKPSRQDDRQLLDDAAYESTAEDYVTDAETRAKHEEDGDDDTAGDDGLSERTGGTEEDDRSASP